MARGARKRGCPRVHRPLGRAVLPARSELSARISKDLKKQGFHFVGSTIVHALLQAVGVVDDHSRDCFRCHARNRIR